MAKKTKVIDFNSKKEVEEPICEEACEDLKAPEPVDEKAEVPVEQGPTLQNLTDDQRAILVSEYNRNNAGVAKIDPEYFEVDEAYCEECKKAFEQVTNEVNEMKYLIADKEKALETAVFLADWNANKNHWHRAYWRGVIKFNEFIEAKIDKLENGEEEELTFDYPALIFIYQSMMNPQGIGLLEAQEMAAIDDQYNAILEVIGAWVDKIQLYDKKSKLYQERWALACNGFKMDILIEDLEDFANVDMSQRQ